MQLPDTSALEFLEKEWPVIKAAPVTFSLCVIVSALILGALIWLFFKERLEKREETIEHQDREIERLKRESKHDPKSSVTAAPISDPFLNPQWLEVTGKEFINEVVELDGKRFYDCKFTNVRFSYRGIAPCELMHSQVTGSVVLETENGAIRCYTHLERIFEKMGKVDHVSVDKDGKRKAIEPSVVEVKQPTLSDRTFALCKELRAYMKQLELKPEYTGSGTPEATAQFFKSVLVWREKFNAGYMLRFDARVRQIRHELAEKGFRDGAVDFLMGGDVSSQQTLDDAIEALSLMAVKLDD